MAATSRRPVLSTFQRLAVVLLVGGLTIGGLALAGKPSGGGGKTKPAISVSPTSLAFGDQAVNTTSVAKPVTITSSGTASLIINSVTLSGSSYFAISGGCTAGSTLAPGATCTINVAFTPAAAGSVTGNIAIVSNASNTPTVNVALSGTGKSTTTVAVRLGKGGGDSIMRGYNADCTSNTGLFSFLCYGGGDKPQYSFFDGSSTTVLSIEDRYIQVDPLFSADQNAAASGSEMTDPAKNNFLAQATAIVTGTTQPARVFIELGGNDICNRGTVSQLYSDSTWETAVRAGLDKLVAGLPDGSTVLMVSVPRVQDLRAAGIQKQQTASSVNCENFWASYDVCRIATASDANFAAIDERQKAYNAKLAVLAAEYNGRALETRVEVATDYDPAFNASVGSYSFQPGDINGGDCFHPSIQGQNRLSEVIWNRNPHK
jgi:lysophospholipase L1-like esterase